MPKSPHDHSLTAAVGTSLATIETKCWGDEYAEADALSEAVRNAIDGYRGTTAGVAIGAIILDDDYDEYFNPPDATEQGIYVVTFEWKVRYDESIPTL